MLLRLMVIAVAVTVEGYCGCCYGFRLLRLLLRFPVIAVSVTVEGHCDYCYG